jgi:hypothetical protein
MVEDDNRLSAFVIVLFCAVAWIGIQYLGYAEFSVAGRMLFRGDFQRTLKARLDLNALEKNVSAAKTVEECWASMVEAAPKFGFVCCRMEVSGMTFEDPNRTFHDDPTRGWVCRVPIAAHGFIEMVRDTGGITLSTIAVPFVDLVHIRLTKRIQELLDNRPGQAPLPIPELSPSESAS